VAYILYYRGKGKALMAHVSEYLVLVDLDEIDDTDKQGNCAPGFELHSCIEFDADISGLPTEEPLIPERYR